MEFDRIKTLSDESLKQLSLQAHRMIETGDPERMPGEIMLSVIGAVAANRTCQRVPRPKPGDSIT